jgi:hypothetical protein
MACFKELLRDLGIHFTTIPVFDFKVGTVIIMVPQQHFNEFDEIEEMTIADLGDYDNGEGRWAYITMTNGIEYRFKRGNHYATPNQPIGIDFDDLDVLMDHILRFEGVDLTEYEDPR